MDTYELVITCGRVMDPETMYDDVANVAITDGRIAVITKDEITGKETIDAEGLTDANLAAIPATTIPQACPGTISCAKRSPAGPSAALLLAPVATTSASGGP